jgi:hypothetical protein
MKNTVTLLKRPQLFPSYIICPNGDNKVWGGTVGRYLNPRCCGPQHPLHTGKNLRISNHFFYQCRSGENVKSLKLIYGESVGEKGGWEERKV